MHPSPLEGCQATSPKKKQHPFGVTSKIHTIHLSGHGAWLARKGRSSEFVAMLPPESLMGKLMETRATSAHSWPSGYGGVTYQYLKVPVRIRRLTDI